MSFLKLFPRQKSKDSGRELRGPYVPLDTLDLDYSISAVASNLVLNCTSCKSLQAVGAASDDNGADRSYSGLVGLISKGVFMVYQLDIICNEQFVYKIVQTIQTPNVTNPLIRPAILVAKWLRLKKQRKDLTVLVLGSNMGVMIYSEDGSRVLCTFEYPASLPEMMCRHVAATESQILIGNARGEIHIFDVVDGKVQFRRTSMVQKEPITEMCCRQCILAVGSPTGTVRIWKIRKQRAIKLSCFKTIIEECVTGLGVWEGCIIATYGSGVFRIFDLVSRKLLVRVFAHSRWIVSMDLLAHQGLLLTVAEDDAVLTWKLRIEPDDRRHGLKSFGSIKNIKNRIKSMERSSKLRRKRPKVRPALHGASKCSIHHIFLALLAAKQFPMFLVVSQPLWLVISTPMFSNIVFYFCSFFAIVIVARQLKISVELDSAIPADNMLLVGGRFVTCLGNVVALANYGVKEVYFYSRGVSEDQTDD